LGYSPERINPGDPEHRFETVRKVISGYTPKCLEVIAQTYGAVVKAGTFSASSIKVAEAAKVIENSQRDLNIAFVNELALICARLEIDTLDVIEAASTKWNFLPFKPGLVGGHCISVDPFYLAHAAARTGYHSEVILAGRRMNDGMGRHVAHECVKRLIKAGLVDKRVAILGVTFKEDVPDVRNSKVMDIIRELIAFGIQVTVADPLADPVTCKHEFGIALTPLERMEPVNAAILAVPHLDYRKRGWSLMNELLQSGRGLVFDVKGILDRATRPEGIELWRL
jgi:UDP-N-acetyl-D-galactosamine dehydrogenase